VNDIANCVRTNMVDDNGTPTGGSVEGVGILIRWQDGPLGRGADRKEPNGAFVETVISALIQRMEFYQRAHDGKFFCVENMRCIAKLKSALEALEARSREREGRGVEGAHEA
jgi:hypothetical protein